MQTNYEVRYATNPNDFKTYDTERIRHDFLIKGLMQADQVNMVYTHYDRYIAGGAMPVKEQLTLETIDPLKADYFLERRELGIINVGNKGTVIVDGIKMEVDFKEALYVGRGAKEVIFESTDSSNPSLFYFNSAPAHHAYETKLIKREDAEIVELGALETSNARTIRKLIVNSIVQTCQLQMGMTELKTGSVWNTMPAHIHDRRMEVYFYFELAEDQAVCHFMGQAQESRGVWLQNQDAVISPPWSMHCGAGTSNYTFIWGMAGENLDYGDMDKFSPGEMK
ncbi:MAG: 5-dehydro-4-deoxy-D-glucuronate isomerase [Bacteroidota bacterium]